MKQEITLYHYWRSSASWRVRYALELKKVPYEKVAVDLLKSEEKQTEYRRLNPAGYVPCLVVGKDQALAESLAIMEWLEERYPEPSLFAGDAFLRARIRQLAETVNSGIQPLQNLDVTRKISADTEQQAEWTRYWIERGLGVFENILSSLDRKEMKFCVADYPTLADICLIPQCYAALRFQVELSNFPQCKAVYEHALSTAECKASHPEAFQP